MIRDFLIILVFFLLLFVFPVLGAGPLINVTTTSGDDILSAPPVWNTSTPISYHLESGVCGPYANEDMAAMFAEVLSVWTDIASVDLAFLAVEGAVGSVDASNYENTLYLDAGSSEELLTDGINPVVFDDDGEITAAIFGDGNEYLLLGFAGITSFTDGELLDGQAVINCKCLADHPTESCVIDSGAGDVTVEMTEANLEFTLAHEMGHFLNMGHTNVNSDLYMAETYSEGDVPIMFPLESGMTTIAPHEDDILSLTSLYPAGDVADHYCVVEGYVMDSTGENYLPCVDVWAVTEDEDPTQTLSYTTASNNYFNTQTDNDFALSDDCDANCGFFSLRIKPATAYTLKAYDVYSTFVDASSVGPCTTEQPEYGLNGVALMTISADDCPTATATPIDAGEMTVDAEADTGDDNGDDADDSDKLDDDAQYNPMNGGCSLSTADCQQLTANGFLVMAFGFMLIFTKRLPLVPSPPI